MQADTIIIIDFLLFIHIIKQSMMKTFAHKIFLVAMEFIGWNRENYW